MTNLLGSEFPCYVICETSDRDAWLSARDKRGIGASESPTILGFNPYEQPVVLFARRLGALPPLEESGPMRLGRLIEPIVIQEYSIQGDEAVINNRYLYGSKRWDFLICTPDGMCFDSDPVKAVQVKLTRLSGAWKENVPAHVWVQAQHEMAVLGTEVETVVALLDSTNIVWDHIPRDDGFIEDMLVPQVERFWNCLRLGKSLPVDMIDGSKETSRAIAKMYPELFPGSDFGGESSVDLPGEYVELAAHLEELEAKRADIDNEIGKIKNRFASSIGTATYGRLANGVVFSYKTVKRPGQYHKASKYRVLRRLKGGS